MSESLPPGTQWLRGQRRKRDNPEDMFTPQQNYDRNRFYAKPGPYWTKLEPAQETQFRHWVKQNNVDFDPDEDQPDYDMRGFWQAMQRGDPVAAGAVDPNDKQRHWPDRWKTPYDATFSAQSQWAVPGLAPDWKGDQLTLPSGHVIYDDKAGKWFGPPSQLNLPGG